MIKNTDFIFTVIILSQTVFGFVGVKIENALISLGNGNIIEHQYLNRTALGSKNLPEKTIRDFMIKIFGMELNLKKNTNILIQLKKKQFNIE